MKKTLIAVVAVFALLGVTLAAQKPPTTTAQKPATTAQKAPATAAQKPAAAAEKPAAAAQKPLDIKTLPPAVQKGIQEQTKGAQIKNISKEVEEGKTQYEVETTVSGRTRDLTFDTAGKVIAIEEEALDMKTLPPAIQKGVQDQTKGAQIKNISSTVENGKTQYEVETLVNGRTRDLTFDSTGTAIVIEEEATLDSIPAPAKAAIQKKVAGSKITKVETLTRGKTTTYEATFTTKAGKASEVEVNADGSAAKPVEK